MHTENSFLDFYGTFGQQGKKKRRHNNKCPRCNGFSRPPFTGKVEAIGFKLIYSCPQCEIKWISRDSFGNNPLQYHMVSYLKEGDVYKDLGMYAG